MNIGETDGWTYVAACCALTFQDGKPQIDAAVDAAIAKEKQQESLK